MAIPIQIRIGDSSSPILAIMSIWEPLGGTLSKNYQIGVVGTITGDSLNVAKAIQINIGASSFPILAIIGIWKPLGGTFK